MTVLIATNQGGLPPVPSPLQSNVKIPSVNDYRVDVYGLDPFSPIAVHYFDADNPGDAQNVARQIVAECDGISGDVFTYAHGAAGRSLCTVEVA